MKLLLHGYRSSHEGQTGQVGSQRLCDWAPAGGIWWYPPGHQSLCRHRHHEPQYIGFHQVGPVQPLLHAYRDESTVALKPDAAGTCHPTRGSRNLQGPRCQAFEKVLCSHTAMPARVLGVVHGPAANAGTGCRLLCKACCLHVHQAHHLVYIAAPPV